MDLRGKKKRKCFQLYPRGKKVREYLSPVDDTVHHPAVPDVEPGDEGHVVHRDDAVIVDQDRGLVAGDLLQPPDLMVVVRPGQVAHGVGREVQALQLVQLAAEIIIHPAQYLGAHPRLTAVTVGVD